jgi:hypothetical protein
LPSSQFIRYIAVSAIDAGLFGAGCYAFVLAGRTVRPPRGISRGEASLVWRGSLAMGVAVTLAVAVRSPLIVVALAIPVFEVAKRRLAKWQRLSKLQSQIALVFLAYFVVLLRRIPDRGQRLRLSALSAL